MTNGELDGIRDALVEFVGALDGFEPRNAAQLELLVLNAIGPFGHPDLPAEVVALLPAVLRERGDELAAGVLAALAALAPDPLREFAAEARGELAATSVISPFAGEVGTLELRECYRVVLAEGEAEMLGAQLQRPADANAQAAVVFVEHEPCGDVIVRGLLSGPEKPRAVRKLVQAPHPDTGPAEPIDGAELAQVLRAALEHMVDHDLELPIDVLPPLLSLERALGGTWPRPRLGRSEEVDAELRADADALVEAFARDYGDDAAFVADLMCHWKVDYVGGRPDRWTEVDLHEFLLDWYPRKGDSDDESLAAVPASAVAFLIFLDQMGGLAGDRVETLTAAVERLRPRFEREARDPRNWGPAKAMVERMRTEGVDPAEPGALEAWVEGFNARPFEDRDRVLAPSLPRPAPRNVERRKAQRRTTKASRRRNRR